MEGTQSIVSAGHIRQDAASVADLIFEYEQLAQQEVAEIDRITIRLAEEVPYDLRQAPELAAVWVKSRARQIYRENNHEEYKRTYELHARIDGIMSRARLLEQAAAADLAIFRSSKS